MENLLLSTLKEIDFWDKLSTIIDFEIKNLGEYFNDLDKKKILFDKKRFNYFQDYKKMFEKLKQATDEKDFEKLDLLYWKLQETLEYTHSGIKNYIASPQYENKEQNIPYQIHKTTTCDLLESISLLLDLIEDIQINKRLIDVLMDDDKIYLILKYPDEIIKYKIDSTITYTDDFNEEKIDFIIISDASMQINCTVHYTR